MDDFFTPCVMMDRVTMPDGYGGYKPTFADGAHVMIAIVLPKPQEIIAAQQKGVKVEYDVLTRKNINLQYHDVFKRLEDGKIFRVTSDGDDNKSPDRATIDLRKVTAEEWSLVQEREISE